MPKTAHEMEKSVAHANPVLEFVRWRHEVDRGYLRDTFDLALGYFSGKGLAHPVATSLAGQLRTATDEWLCLDSVQQWLGEGDLNDGTLLVVLGAKVVEAAEEPTNDTSADTVIRALSKVLPPRYVPVRWLIENEWTGAERHGSVEWAERALRARISGAEAPETPHWIREYLRWGSGTVLVSCRRHQVAGCDPIYVFKTPTGAWYEVHESGTVLYQDPLGTSSKRHHAPSFAEGLDWVLKHQGVLS